MQLVSVASALYDGALSQHAGRFREWMLERVAAEIGATAALWRRAQTGRGTHALSVVGVSQAFPRAWERTRDINALLIAAQASPGEVFRLRHSTLPTALEDTRLYRRVLKAFELGDAVGAVVRDPLLGLQTEVCLFRAAGAEAFDAEQADFLQQLLPFMVGAAAHAYFLSLAKPSGRYADRPSAVIDASGQVVDAQDGFSRVVRQAYPDWNGGALPFDLPEDLNRDVIEVGALNVYGEFLADLTLVRVWRRERLEALTEREMQIAELAASGRSYKLIARELGISPSTVSNHLHRIYTKVGVANRNQLADMVNG